MEIPVLIEPIAENGYRASAGPSLGLTADGTTRQEALDKLGQLFAARLAAGAEIVPLPIATPGNPWKSMEGIFKDDPFFDEWQQAIADLRRKADEDPDYL